MRILKVLPAVLLTSALGVVAAAAQDYRHNAKPATHRSFNREMTSKQKTAKASNKARRVQMKRRTTRRPN